MRIIRGLILIIFFCQNLVWAGSNDENIVKFFSDLRSELVLSFHNSNRHFYGRNSLHQKFLAEKESYDLGFELVNRFKELSSKMNRRQVIEAVEVFAEIQRVYKIKFYTTVGKSHLVPFKNPDYEHNNMPEDVRTRTYSKTFKERATRLARLTIHQSRDMILGSFVLGALKSATKGNPMGMADAIKESTDPIFLATMPAFTYIDYKVEKAFGNPKSFFPKQLARYSAMSAGFFVTGIMEEFLRDVLMGDGAECRSSTDSTNEACVRFWDRWSSRDKYISYTPEAIALMMAAATAAGATAPVLKAIESAKHMTIRVVEKRSLPAVLASFGKKAIKQGALAHPGLGLPRFVYTAGNMAIIIGLQEHYSPIVNDYWRPLNLQYLGWSLSEDLKKDKEKTNSDFIRKKNNIDNEIKKFDANLDRLSEYASKKTMGDCIQKQIDSLDIEDLIPNIPGQDEIFDSVSDDLKIDNKRITKINQKCRREAIPGFLIKADSAFTKAEFSNKLLNFEMKQESWHRLVGDFSENYKVARAVYKYILGLKKNSGKTIEDLVKEELSKETIRNVAKAAGTHTALEQEAGLMGKKKAQIKQYRDLVNGTQFGDIADFIIYHMACGPSLREKESLTQGEGSFKNLSDIEFIKTPFGSSLEFLPPKVTAGSKSVCNSLNYIYTNLRSRHLKLDTDLIQRLNVEESDIYLPVWKGENDSTYGSLVAYVYNNLDKSFIDYDELSLNEDFESDGVEYDFKWWTKNIRTEVDRVWALYDTAYQKLIRTELLPILIRTEENTYQPQKKLRGPAPGKRAKILTAMHKSKEKPLYIQNTIHRIEHGFNRLVKISEMSSKDRVLMGFTSSLVKKHSAEALESFKDEAFFHEEFLSYWNNFDDLYETDEDQSEIKEDVFDSLKKISDLYKKSLKVSSYYSLKVLRLVVSDQCSEEKLKELQTIRPTYKYSGPEYVWKNRVQKELSDTNSDQLAVGNSQSSVYLTIDPKAYRPKSFRDLTCSDADQKYASNLIDRNYKEQFYFGLVGIQIDVLLSEMENYFNILTKLTKSIGYKKEEI